MDILCFLFYFSICDGKGQKTWKSTKKMISTSHLHAEHLFAGWNTQHSAVTFIVSNRFYFNSVQSCNMLLWSSFDCFRKSKKLLYILYTSNKSNFLQIKKITNLFKPINISGLIERPTQDLQKIPIKITLKSLKIRQKVWVYVICAFHNCQSHPDQTQHGAPSHPWAHLRLPGSQKYWPPGYSPYWGVEGLYVNRCLVVVRTL